MSILPLLEVAMDSWLGTRQKLILLYSKQPVHLTIIVEFLTLEL